MSLVVLLSLQPVKVPRSIDEALPIEACPPHPFTYPYPRLYTYGVPPPYASLYNALPMFPPTYGVPLAHGASALPRAPTCTTVPPKQP
jgi:hypothetical protein